jgi:hypothetical protein
MKKRRGLKPLHSATIDVSVYSLSHAERETLPVAPARTRTTTLKFYVVTILVTESFQVTVQVAYHLTDLIDLEHVFVIDVESAEVRFRAFRRGIDHHVCILSRLMRTV